MAQEFGFGKDFSQENLERKVEQMKVFTRNSDIVKGFLQQLPGRLTEEGRLCLSHAKDLRTALDQTNVAYDTRVEAIAQYLLKPDSRGEQLWVDLLRAIRNYRAYNLKPWWESDSPNVASYAVSKPISIH